MRKSGILFLLFVLIWLMGCSGEESAHRSTTVVPTDARSPCRKILEGEDCLTMWTMSYDDQQNAVYGKILDRAFRCSVGKLPVEEEADFITLLECGQGPGDIQGVINYVEFADDHLYVRDRPSRIQAFNREGDYLRTLKGNKDENSPMPHQVNFHVSGKTVWAAGMNSAQQLVVTKYRITDNNTLDMEKDIAVIADWREHIANGEIDPSRVIRPFQFVWMEEQQLFIGCSLWGQYILLDLQSGSYHYENILLSSKKARTLPNRSKPNFHAAFFLNGHIALLEVISKPFQLEGHTIERHYRVVIQQPEIDSMVVFNPLETGCWESIFGVTGMGAVATGPDSFLVFELVKSDPDSDWDCRYMQYQL